MLHFAKPARIYPPEPACIYPPEPNRVYPPETVAVTTAAFDRVCQSLSTRINGNKDAKQTLALLPDETPRGPFDLIVASEIAYYLRPTALSRLLSQLETALAPGGRIVFLHHVRPFDDAAQPPATAQTRIRARFNAMQLVFQKRDRGFEAVAFCKPACGKAVRRGAPGHLPL